MSLVKLKALMYANPQPTITDSFILQEKDNVMKTGINTSAPEMTERSLIKL